MFEEQRTLEGDRAMKAKPLKISAVKGRPMLHWVGKKPLERVQYFPAQLCESVGVERPPVEPSFQAFTNSDHNLLFHGDNKEILAALIVAGFRGKIDLIYIDPPFDSGADYVRKVKLRGLPEKLPGEGHSFIEQTQYEDIWANDNYLQFMYERLILMRELLSDKGSLYLHCDWHKSHHLRFLLDECFGAENFRNEIILEKNGRSKRYIPTVRLLHKPIAYIFIQKIPISNLINFTSRFQMNM